VNEYEPTLPLTPVSRAYLKQLARKYGRLCGIPVFVAEDFTVWPERAPGYGAEWLRGQVAQ
jgi:hypothetical protein